MKRSLIVPLFFVAPFASGAEYTELLPQQSSIVFVSKQMNVPVEGTFKNFSARIAVDPAKPETGKAQIEIELAGIDTGSAEADEEVANQTWFDTRNHPVARFTAESISNVGKGQYAATGKMTIKGKTLEIKTPFTLRQAGGVLVIEGAFPLKRLDFGIGTGIWEDTSVVSDEVQIRFSLSVATAKK